MKAKTKFTPSIEATNWLNLLHQSHSLGHFSNTVGGNTEKFALGGVMTGEEGIIIGEEKKTDPTKTVVTVDPGEPTFHSEKDFTKFYRTKAENYLKTSDPDFYSKYQEAVASGDDLKAQSYLAARGGLPRYVVPPKMKDVPYSNYAPDRTNLKDYIKTIKEKSIEVKKYNQEFKKKEKTQLSKVNTNDLNVASNQF